MSDSLIKETNKLFSKHMYITNLLSCLVLSLSSRYLLVTKCEAVVSALDSQIKFELKAFTGLMLKPKQEFFAKSVSQIINEQRGSKKIFSTAYFHHTHCYEDYLHFCSFFFVVLRQVQEWL